MRAWCYKFVVFNMLNIIRRIMLCTSWFALMFLSLPNLASTSFNVHLSQFPLLQGFNTATVNIQKKNKKITLLTTNEHKSVAISSLKKDPISGIIQPDSAALKPLQIHSSPCSYKCCFSCCRGAANGTCNSRNVDRRIHRLMWTCCAWQGTRSRRHGKPSKMISL